MKSQSNFPPDVREAIHANRKIEAIKLLREHNGMGLKEAKDAVEAYIRDNRQLIPEKTASGANLCRLIIVLLIIIAVLVLYRITEQ